MTNINITLIKTEKDDLDAFFQFQLDKEANEARSITDDKQSKNRFQLLLGACSTLIILVKFSRIDFL